MATKTTAPTGASLSWQVTAPPAVDLVISLPQPSLACLSGTVSIAIRGGRLPQVRPESLALLVDGPSDLKWEQTPGGWVGWRERPGLTQLRWRLPAHTQPHPVNWVVSLADVVLVQAWGLWNHDLSPNAQVLAERLILKHWLRSLPTTPEGAVLASTTAPTERSLDWDQSLAALLPTVLAGYEGWQSLGLDPQRDFVGANLTSVDWRGSDWSGCDLRRTNWRGANLNDVDFSGADLRHSRWAGADLSGALLSDARLRGADFRRASLALVNLAGADLSQADLREANLSRANLTGANVVGARFGNNAGLDAEQIATLRDRGALFVVES
ncbi:pentapeptide repeat-containing protein [Synechococcus elongatus IITB7]|uniref:pentapeptide repeat-containing protein n=1 Tax=Synechococcus elongatus TaxID=32046 RepID=UPI0030CBE476